MRRRSILLVLLLVVVGATATTTVVLGRYAGAARIHGAPAADVGSAEHTVTLENRTDGRIWVGSNVNADGSAALTGLPVLDAGQSATITVPEREGAGHWRGTFFARQGCSGDDGTTFHCAVGDCGPYADHCTTGQQPTSLAEFNFDPADSAAPWYDVSYVDAVSTAVTITPNDVTPPATGECAVAGCAVDLLSSCPAEDLTKDGATGEPLVCVNPNRDAKTPYSDAINQKCPTAYAWSKQDAEPGNRTMYQCTKCSGLTVAFNGPGDSAAPAPGTPPASDRTDSPAAPLKGVSLNPVDGASQALADSGASWYFNWAASTGSVTRPDGVEYVPMIWGSGSVTDDQLAAAQQEGTELLGFNEPDLAGQADMTPEQALDLWPRLESTGLRLGAPAVSSGADTPGGWLDRFMQGAEQRGLRVDFIPLHWYGADFGPNAVGQLHDYLQRVHDLYHKPIWLTEYGLIDFSQGSPRYPGQQEETDFIKSSTPMLDGLDYLERYAWFTLSTQTSPTGLYDGTTANAVGQAYREAS
ncbi:glycosyl hydrolase [Streptomyces sp. NPDC007851]|uniref:glycosyl hydrolase n=1 Tax=Streptomyces sp. NPDC007851 TaxID=3155008 RepID=UPI0033C61F96